ncbi:unnamed protein product [Ectocarpus sp. 12 AP-2014]
MVTMQPPPAYSGGQQAPPAYSGNQAPPPPAYSGEGGKRQNPGAYWGYWIVLFVTAIFTWIFAVAAAADDAWIEDFSKAGLGDSCDGYDFCGLYKAATAFQYLATIVISVVLVVVVVAAFMPAPVTGKLGLAVGIMLFVFAVFELIAFSTYAAYIQERAIMNQSSTIFVALQLSSFAGHEAGRPMPLTQQAVYQCWTYMGCPATSKRENKNVSFSSTDVAVHAGRENARVDAFVALQAVARALEAMVASKRHLPQRTYSRTNPIHLVYVNERKIICPVPDPSRHAFLSPVAPYRGRPPPSRGFVVLCLLLLRCLLRRLLPWSYPCRGRRCFRLWFGGRHRDLHSAQQGNDRTRRSFQGVHV